MRRFLVAPALIALAAALTLGSGCSDDESDLLPPDPECIGPEGGAVTIPYEDHPFYGASVSARPGAWDECWSVRFGYEWTFSTPDFPDGLQGYQDFMTGSLDIDMGRQETMERWVEAPESLEFGLGFSRANGYLPEVGEMVTAFRYDDDAGLWRLALPDTLDDTRLVVNTNRRDGLWTWGLIDLGEIDFDLYVVPAMQELHGSETWVQVVAELQELHESIVAGNMEINCANLFTVRSLFASVRDQAAVSLQAFQNGLGGLCGVCDVTSSAFYESVLDYARLNLQAWIYQTLFVENSPHWLVTIYGMVMVGYTHGAITNLPCDFECFLAAGTTEFYLDLAVYYVSTLVVEVINYAIWSGWIDC